MSLLNNEQGQGPIEYTLPIVFVHLASAARFRFGGGRKATNPQLAYAAHTAS